MANVELDSSEKTMKVACGNRTPVPLFLRDCCLCLQSSLASKNVFSIHSSQKIKERTKAVVNVGQERHRDVKMFGTLWFLQAHGGGLEENNDGWRFLLMAVVEAMRAGEGLQECVTGIIQKQDVSVTSCHRAKGIA